MFRSGSASVMRVTILVALCCLVPLTALGDDTQVFVDSFDLPREGRKAGDALAGKKLEEGDATWAAGPLAMIEGGGVSGSNWNGGEAHHRLPRVAGQITCQADFRITGVDSCVGVAIGGNIGGNFFRDVELNLIIGPTGGWELNAPRSRQRLATGDKATFPDFDADGLTTLVLEVDTRGPKVTAKINGKTVVDAMDISDKNVEVLGGSAGFRINGPAKPGDPLVRNYRATAQGIATAGLRSPGPDHFILEPGVAHTLTWQAQSIGREPSAPFEVVDYWGRSVTAGKAAVAADGKVTTEVSLDHGYYEVRFPEAGETFGLMALPKPDQEADQFFGMDAALSELERRPAMRKSLAIAMKRSGIAMARERYNVGMSNHNVDVWQWDAGTRQDEMRKIYAEAGLDILEIVRHGVGHPHLGRNQTSGFYTNYPQFARSFREIALRYQDGWAACEVWNEPDHGSTPADQYVTMVKAASYAANEAGMTMPLVSGVFAAIPPGAYFDTCAANGMLEHSDAVSFHSYDRATAFEGVVWNCRQWLIASGQAAMPIWITECGHPWQTGPARASMKQDMVSASEIVMKGIEAKACGVASYHPFVLVAYAEGDRSFGMMGREVTPMRSYAAYARSAVILRDARYIGDLRHTDESLRRARVFQTPTDEWIAVLFTGEPNADAGVTLPLQPERIEGIDGRALTALDSGAVPVPDGLAYAWLDAAAAKPHLITDTRAAELLRASEGWKPRPRTSSPIVLEFRFEDASVRTTPRRYIVPAEQLGEFAFTVRAHNLSESAHTVTLQPRGSEDRTIGQPQTIEVGALASMDVSWVIDLESFVDVAEVRFIHVAAEAPGLNRITPLAIPMITEGDLLQHLARHSTVLQLPVRTASHWSNNIVGHGRMNVVETEGSARFDLTFNGGDRWAFPQLKMPDGVDLSEATGLLVRARIARWSRDVGLLLWLDDGRESFQLLDLFPPDGNWHVIYVPFEELKPRSGHPAAQNARFDPKRLRSLALGMVTGSGENNVLEISDLIVVGKPPVAQ